MREDAKPSYTALKDAKLTYTWDGTKLETFWLNGWDNSRTAIVLDFVPTIPELRQWGYLSLEERQK